MSKPNETLHPVVVTGFKDASHATYERLLEGAAAYEKHKSHAPDAPLRFQARGTDGTPMVDKLWFSSDARRVPLEVDARGRFELPMFTGPEDHDAEIVSAHRSGKLKVSAELRSPGTSDERRRLGDLRVECEVFWAMDRADRSFFERNGAALIGGICRSDLVQVRYKVRRQLQSAIITFGDRSEPVTIVAGGFGFRPPVYDASWPDDAVVTMVFEKNPAAPPTP